MDTTSAPSTSQEISHSPQMDKCQLVDSSDRPKKIGIKNKDADVFKKKPRLRTFEECLNWIKHDSRFDIEDFTLCYEDRFSGLMEMPLTSFETEDKQSEEFIPMHRVWLLIKNGTIVWDRKNRVDMLSESLSRAKN